MKNIIQMSGAGILFLVMTSLLSGCHNAHGLPPEKLEVRAIPGSIERYYEHPSLEEGDNLWYYWFDTFYNTLVTDDGRELFAPHFFALFASPGQSGSDVINFGDYMSINLPDSDHINPLWGEQDAWLERVLSEQQHVSHGFPKYHSVTLPSVRDFDDVTLRMLRKTWVPLFEQYDLRVVFEINDHACKRTKQIRHNRVNPSREIVYVSERFLGDGTAKYRK